MKINKKLIKSFYLLVLLGIFTIKPQILLANKLFIYETSPAIQYKNKIYNYILEINSYIPENIYTDKLLTKKYIYNSSKKNNTALIIIKSNNAINNSKSNKKNNDDTIKINDSTKNLINVLKQELKINNVTLLHYSDNNIKNYHIILYIN